MRTASPRDEGWVDGSWGPLSRAAIQVDDPAFHHGLGLFETLALCQGKILDLEAHLSRLQQGAARLGLQLPDRGTLAQAVGTTARHQGKGPAWIKIVATRGGRCSVFAGDLQPTDGDAGVRAVILPWRSAGRGPLSGLKTLNYAANILGLEHARGRGADEGLWLDGRGKLTEGCTSNLFVIHGGKLFTAAIREGILPGIVRGIVIDVARERGLMVHEGKLRPARLERAQEAFLTSSLRGVQPLIQVDARPVGQGTVGHTTAWLAAQVQRRRLEGGTLAAEERD